MNKKQKELFKNLSKMDKMGEIETSELCPHCNCETNMNHMIGKCEHCGKLIVACSMCDCDIMDCSKCPWNVME